MTEEIIEALEEVSFVNYVHELTDDHAMYEYEVVAELSLIRGGDIETIESCGVVVRAIGSGSDYGLSFYVDIQATDSRDDTMLSMGTSAVA